MINLKECKNCGKITNLTRHHIIFKSQGGSDLPNNIEILCRPCHNKVHNIKPNPIKRGHYKKKYFCLCGYKVNEKGQICPFCWSYKHLGLISLTPKKVKQVRRYTNKTKTMMKIRKYYLSNSKWLS